MDEYAEARALDPRRARRLADLVLERARETGPRRGGGAFRRERSRGRADPARRLPLRPQGHAHRRRPACVRPAARARLNGLVAALGGRRVAPGPGGAPSRGRLDVLPTGRNLYSLDPRAVPTRTAWELGQRAGEAFLAAYVRGSRRLAAQRGVRSLGQRRDAHRRRGSRAGALAHRRAAVVGHDVQPRQRLRGADARRARASARRCDLAHLRPVPRRVPRADRAVPRGGRGRRRARGRDGGRKSLARRIGRARVRRRAGRLWNGRRARGALRRLGAPRGSRRDLSRRDPLRLCGRRGAGNRRIPRQAAPGAGLRACAGHGRPGRARFRRFRRA